MELTDEEVAELYDRFAHVLFHRCRSILRNDEEAWDAVQETFARVIRNADSFRQQSSPLTWMYKISTNYSLNQLRNRNSRAKTRRERKEEIVGPEATEPPTEASEDHERILELLEGRSRDGRPADARLRGPHLLRRVHARGDGPARGPVGPHGAQAHQHLPGPGTAPARGRGRGPARPAPVDAAMTAPENLRPSKLLLDRFATGELGAEEAEALEAHFDDRAHKHLDAVEAAKAEVPTIDLEGLRARAAALPDVEEDDAYGLFVEDAPTEQAGLTEVAGTGAPSPTLPAPANNTRAFAALGTVGTLLLAAAIALFALVPAASEPTLVGYHGVKSGEVLRLLAEGDDGLLHGYDAAKDVVGEGDLLGFQVGTKGHESVVVLSVDGSGAVTLFFPEQGPDPLALDPEVALMLLDGTVRLDNAPGPEVFVAVYDTGVYEALDQLSEVFAADGHAGVEAWAAATEGVVAAPIRRR